MDPSECRGRFGRESGSAAGDAGCQSDAEENVCGRRRKYGGILSEERNCGILQLHGGAGDDYILKVMEK